MPTLEDVFLNVAAEDSKIENQKLREKLAETEKENDKLLFETDFKEDYTKRSKFCNDLKACFSRRFILTSRDIKGFVMEILCPILLVLVGLIVSQIDMIGASEPTEMDIGAIGKQIIFYGKTDNGINIDQYHFNNIENITCENIDNLGTGDEKAKIKSFISAFYNRAKDKEDSIDHEVDMTAEDYVGYFGGFLMLKDDANEHKFVEVLNTRVSHIVPLFTVNFFKRFLEEKCPGVIINL